MNLTILNTYVVSVKLVTPLDKLVASHLVEAGTQKFLVILNLKVLLKIKHKEYGCIFPLFLQVLQDNFIISKKNVGIKLILYVQKLYKS